MVYALLLLARQLKMPPQILPFAIFPLMSHKCYQFTLSDKLSIVETFPDFQPLEKRSGTVLTPL